MYCYRFHKPGLKTPTLYMLPNMKGLVEDAMYIYQGETTMSEGCSDQGGVWGHGFKSGGVPNL